ALLLLAFGTVRGVLKRNVPIAPVPSAVNTPPPGTVVNVNVQQGESTSDIAKELQAKGLVPSDAVFVGFLKLRNGGTTIQPGLHEIPAGSSLEQIVANLEQPVVPKEIRVTFPEG